MKSHQDIFTESEAIKYLRLDNRESLAALCDRFNFSPVTPPHNQPLFHRDQLDLLAQLMFGIPIRSLPRRGEAEAAETLPDCLRPLNDMLMRHDWTPNPEPCIYFLIRGGEVVYVGQSINLSNRLMKHGATGRKFDHVVYLPTPAERLDEVERDMIRRLKPQENKAYLGRARV